MPTDLQRIELAFPAEAMLHVVDHGADTSDPEVQRVRRLLLGTVDDALTGLVGRDRRKLRTRLDRTMRAFLAPIVAIGGRVDVVGLIAWRVLAAVLERRRAWCCRRAHPLSDALEEMRPALEQAASDPVAAARADVEWSAALGRLQALGLYADVKPIDHDRRRLIPAADRLIAKLRQLVNCTWEAWAWVTKLFRGGSRTRKPFIASDMEPATLTERIAGWPASSSMQNVRRATTLVGSRRMSRASGVIEPETICSSTSARTPRMPFSTPDRSSARLQPSGDKSAP